LRAQRSGTRNQKDKVESGIKLLTKLEGKGVGGFGSWRNVKAKFLIFEIAEALSSSQDKKSRG